MWFFEVGTTASESAQKNSRLKKIRPEKNPTPRKKIAAKKNRQKIFLYFLLDFCNNLCYSGFVSRWKPKTFWYDSLIKM